MSSLNYQDRQLRLRRFPLKQDDRLRAWDAADEYLLRHLAEDEASPPANGMLLANDSFGALGVALHARRPLSWSDSFLARQALRFNLCENRCDPDAVSFLGADETPEGPLGLVLLKIPKNLTFLQDQLQRLGPALTDGALVLSGGMIKHTPRRAYDLLAEFIGPTTTSLGWKKARLAISRYTPREERDAKDLTSSYEMPDAGFTLQNLPNVFSRERPDAGTRLLLAHLPRVTGEISCVDLGCGNGILALALARSCPAARILGVDESFQAVASARLNAARCGGEPGRLTFRVSDGLAEEEADSQDLIVCNPPFHQGQTTGDLSAWTMFAAAERALRPGGELRIVGNRHLGYHAKLRRIFAEVTLVASDERFVVLRAIKGPDRL